MKHINKIIQKVFLAISFVGVIFLAVGCGAQGSQEKTVKVGINNADEPIWKVVQQKVKKDHINLKIVEFSDYNQPNTALSQGELDINAFQHRFFLSNWNKAHHTNLVAIGNTVIQPMAVYSNKLTDIKQIKNGAKVAVPNDASNEARALQLLENAGLITLKNTKKKLPSTKDIQTNKLNLKFNVLDAAQTAHSLGDVDVAVINGNVANAAKLSAKKVIYKEKISKQSKPWINIIVANKKDQHNKTYQKVVKAFQSADVAKAIKKVYGQGAVTVWNSKF
ncbi:MAG: MetQ/NlpA family ABC transporter substrate-binding protein [Lactobacillus sp.]|uniref:Lipoprotein n=1 Tax=Bombilactobacillus bombi TaxID=1303590 RepID=A0A3R6VJ17_9LACO|nr:MetQ/NlpA family ABC transporter substrate-binding protein [Bombilactobacillus bombi]MCO6541309.1 MetQ/NlpA family ABC transporter substrate-binding protein [Lactobacillus sp.]MCO6542879.1 MetQ/NlpA family ABC transporter substrate-binding protein [Lactobacillus sp.]RHW49881.1 MetQ/NlpA family ABC transporter substrate-binding protein [Bombilactobacillus bombi]